MCVIVVSVCLMFCVCEFWGARARLCFRMWLRVAVVCVIAMCEWVVLLCVGVCLLRVFAQCVLCVCVSCYCVCVLMSACALLYCVSVAFACA